MTKDKYPRTGVRSPGAKARDWLGHVSIETTNRYAEVTTRVKEKALRASRH